MSESQAAKVDRMRHVKPSPCASRKCAGECWQHAAVSEWLMGSGVLMKGPSQIRANSDRIRGYLTSRKLLMMSDFTLKRAARRVDVFGGQVMCLISVCLHLTIQDMSTNQSCNFRPEWYYRIIICTCKNLMTN